VGQRMPPRRAGGQPLHPIYALFSDAECFSQLQGDFETTQLILGVVTIEASRSGNINVYSFSFGLGLSVSRFTTNTPTQLTKDVPIVVSPERGGKRKACEQ